MKATSLKTTSALALFLIAAACGGNPGASGGDASKGAATGPTNDPAVRAATDSMNRQYADAFKAGDAAKAASFYEQDAVSMAPNMEPGSGRAGIEKGLTEAFKAFGKVNEFTTQTKDYDAYPDHVIEVGTYEMSFTPTGAKEPVKDHGSFITYWRKQPDGSWKTHRDAIVSAVPVPGMAPPAPAKK